ncbi:MAG: trigger factor [Lachnospiraceae bacterium]|nr:trigger factor [Lachnospiraceae bacterium]MCI9184443.1 trigger factor [Lachnospiraceae bacterium]
MSIQVENLEKNMAKITVEVPAEQFGQALKTSYNKNKKRFNIPGFRKGKAPQALIEKMYGPGVLYEDAVNQLINDTCGDAMKESGLDIVSRPQISVEQVEKGEAFIYSFQVAVKPEVALGEYKGIEVERARPEVTDADIEAELKKVQDQNSRLVSVEDRPVQDGDQVVIDFDGSMDGVPFEGGKAESYPLTIGSHSFVDTFEEQLIGKNLKEEVEVNVTFPETYHAKELAGKPALFKVVVQEIKVKELPELDDEFASEVSEFDTLDEYKADIKAKLSETKQKQATTENENNVVEKVVGNATMELPEAMIDDQVENMVDNYSRRMRGQGLTMEQYFQFTGLTMDKMKEDLRPQAEKQIRTRLVLEAIVAQEGIQVEDEAVEEEVKKMAASYKLELEKMKEYMGEAELKRLKEDMAVQEAIDFLVAEAKLV